MAFPRTILPIEATGLWLPGALKHVSNSGVVQVRATLAAGWSWVETWGLLNMAKADHVGLLAYVQNAWNRGTIFEATHPLVPGSGRAPNGLGTAGVLVQGADQTGGTLVTDGWPVSTSNCVRAGDVIKVANDNAVYMVVEDADSDGAGSVSITVTPHLRTSPDDNAAVTTSDVLFRVTIASRSQHEGSRSPTYIAGLSLTFREAL